MAILAGVAILLVGRLVPVESLWLWSALCLLAWIAGSWLFALFKPVSLAKTALRIDIDLRLYERLSTSLALSEQSALFAPALVAAQQHDALQSARRINLAVAYPLRFQRKRLLKALLAAVFWIALLVLPNPMDQVLASREEVRQEAARQARQVEELSRQVSEADELDPEQLEEVQRLLAELRDRLATNPGDLDQALADFSASEAELNSFLNPDAALQGVNLKSLADQLSQLAGTGLQEHQDLAAQAEAALEELEGQLGELNEAERNALSASLAQMSAQASQSGDSQLAEALSDLAQAAQARDSRALQNSSQAAGRAFSQAQRSQDADTRLRQLLESLRSSRQSLAANAQRSAQGSQSSGSQGQPGGGGGTNAPVLPPGTGQGQASSPGGTKPPGGEDDLPGQGTTPRESANFIGDELFIPGVDNGQGSNQVLPGQNTAPGVQNPALVPYQQAYYSYLNAAMQSLSQDYIPENLLNYVQQYFLLLEPQ